MWTRTVLPALFVIAALGRPGTARADDAAAFDLASAAPLADKELASQRGGIEIAGLQVTLGADLRTYLNGELALRTIVSWTAAGQSKDVWVSPALTPATVAALQSGSLGNGLITMRMNDSTVYLANNDQTAIVQRADGGLQNIILNVANNVAITQQSDISLNLGNYSAFSAAIATGVIGGGLGDTLSNAAVNATKF